jgi:hypothetical protein
VRLVRIHEETVEAAPTSTNYAGSALDCILHANELSGDDDAIQVALAESMIYAQLATAMAVIEAANVQAKSIYDGRV